MLSTRRHIICADDDLLLVVASTISINVVTRWKSEKNEGGSRRLTNLISILERKSDKSSPSCVSEFIGICIGIRPYFFFFKELKRKKRIGTARGAAQRHVNVNFRIEMSTWGRM